MTLKTGLCRECHEPREIIYRGHCVECTKQVPFVSIRRALGFPEIPFKVGDKVEAYMAREIYDGIGHVDEIRLDGSMASGTPIVAMFHVVIDEPADELAPDEAWYVARCLREVGAAPE